MNPDRVAPIAQSIALLGSEGIAVFDRTEPEHETLVSLYETYDTDTYVKLLGICAATEDYQLNGDAQRFWNELERVGLSHGELASVQDVKEILGTFMDAEVNSRLNKQKRNRLIRIFERGFGEWFVDNHKRVEPVEVWEELADVLNNPMKRKTVVLAMKIYDIAHLIRHGVYLEFPWDIPIPCDLQVERVSRTSGLIDSDDMNETMAAWEEVMKEVSDRVGRDISLLRIDSIVWQAGQVIGTNNRDRIAARDGLVEHFEEVGIESEPASELADELTRAME